MLHLLKPLDSIKTITQCYGIDCAEVDDGPQALAKSVTNKNRTHYFCKFNTYGMEAGHLVNPWSMYIEETPGFVNAVNPHSGKAFQEYKEVNETVFKLYTSYLSSRSNVHYRQAERMALEDV